MLHSTSLLQNANCRMRVDAFFATPSDQAAGVAGGVDVAVAVPLTMVKVDQASSFFKRVRIRAPEQVQMNQKK